MQTEVSALGQRLEDKGVRLLIIFGVVALLNVFTIGHAEAQQHWSPQSWVNQQSCSNWWVEVGGAAFDRPSKSFGLGIVTDPNTNQVLLSAEDVIDLETSFGANVAFGGKTASGQKWEFESTIVNWDEVHDINGPGLATPFATQQVDNFDVAYDSDYYSLALGIKRDVMPGLTLTFGPRFVRLEELLRVETDTTVTVPINFTVQTQDDFEVTNSAIGLQTGFEFNQPLTQLIRIQGFGDFGGYNNHTKFIGTDRDNLGGNPIVTSLSKSTGSFIGEVGGKVYMEVVPGTIQSFVGYQATWIDGIALAPPQALAFGVATPGIETTNTLFFQQIMFGFTIKR